VVRCPFCSNEMRLGSIRVRAYRHFDASVDWEPDPPPRRRSWRNLIFEAPDTLVREVLPPRYFGRSRRVASYCDGCGAVLAHPRGAVDAPVDAPSDAPVDAPVE